jgi:hypothetical protein
VVKKGSKMRARVASSIPMPESRTEDGHVLIADPCLGGADGDTLPRGMASRVHDEVDEDPFELVWVDDDAGRRVAGRSTICVVAHQVPQHDGRSRTTALTSMVRASMTCCREGRSWRVRRAARWEAWTISIVPRAVVAGSDRASIRRS